MNRSEAKIDCPQGQPRRGERSESNHQPQPRAQGSSRHWRTGSIYPWLAQLLQTQLHLQRGAGTVSVGQAEGEVVLLEAVETATHASPPLVSVGSRSQQSAYGDAEPQRLLADEPERDCAIRAQQPLVRRTRSSGHESNLDRSLLPRASSGQLIGTALYGAVRRVVWDSGANHSRGPDSLKLFFG